MADDIEIRVKETITEYVKQLLEDRDDSYLCSNKDRVIKKFIEEICNESSPTLKGCTEIETTTYRTMMGMYSDGQKKNYKQVREILQKGNPRITILNTNRKLMNEIYKELLFEDKVKLILESYEYEKNKGAFLPEYITLEDLSSIIYFEKDTLKELGIENVLDLTSFKRADINDIISNLKTRRKYGKENIGKELIEAIHLLGYLFIDEDGYEDQMNEFDEIRRIMKQEITSEQEKELQESLNYRNNLVFLYNNLKKQEKEGFNQGTEKEMKRLKNEIIMAEGKIRSRKI